MGHLRVNQKECATYSNVLLLPVIILTLRNKNIPSGKVPCKDHLRRRNLVLFGEAHYEGIPTDDGVP